MKYKNEVENLNFHAKLFLCLDNLKILSIKFMAKNINNYAYLYSKVDNFLSNHKEYLFEDNEQLLKLIFKDTVNKINDKTKHKILKYIRKNYINSDKKKFNDDGIAVYVSKSKIFDENKTIDYEISNKDIDLNSEFGKFICYLLLMSKNKKMSVKTVYVSPKSYDKWIMKLVLKNNKEYVIEITNKLNNEYYIQIIYITYDNISSHYTFEMKKKSCILSVDTANYISYNIEANTSDDVDNNENSISSITSILSDDSDIDIEIGNNMIIATRPFNVRNKHDDNDDDDSNNDSSLINTSEDDNDDDDNDDDEEEDDNDNCDDIDSDNEEEEDNCHVNINFINEIAVGSFNLKGSTNKLTFIRDYRDKNGIIYQTSNIYSLVDKYIEEHKDKLFSNWTSIYEYIDNGKYAHNNRAKELINTYISSRYIKTIRTQLLMFKEITYFSSSKIFDENMMPCYEIKPEYVDKNSNNELSILTRFLAKTAGAGKGRLIQATITLLSDNIWQFILIIYKYTQYNFKITVISDTIYNILRLPFESKTLT